MKVFKTFFLLSLITFMLSCEFSMDELIEPKDENFVIKKGEHSSTFSHKKFEGNTISFEAKFNSCASYTTQTPENQADINKLLGFSSCGTHHHQNSARIGWRWFNEQLEIHAYIYENGQRFSDYITAVPVNEVVNYEIKINEGGYLFKVNDVEKQINLTGSCTSNTNYFLWPYFGGDEPAPHDINIYLKIK